MKDIELQNRVIDFLEKKAKQSRTFPQRFTAKEAAEAVGGVTTRIGFISKNTVAELVGRGINIKYEITPASRRFVIDE